MKIPKIYNGMKFIKAYPNFALYEKTTVDSYGNKFTYRESFQYQDLVNGILYRREKKHEQQSFRK